MTFIRFLHLFTKYLQPVTLEIYIDLSDIDVQLAKVDGVCYIIRHKLCTIYAFFEPFSSCLKKIFNQKFYMAFVMLGHRQLNNKVSITYLVRHRLCTIYAFAAFFTFTQKLLANRDDTLHRPMA